MSGRISRQRHALIAAAAAGAVFAATSFTSRHVDGSVWIGGDGNFGDPSNWAGGVPGPGDEARFLNAATYAVTFDLSATNSVLEVGNGDVTFRADLAGSSTYVVSSATQVIGGSLTLGAPTSGTNTLLINTPALLVANATFNVQAGNEFNMIGAATVDLNPGGTLNIADDGTFFDQNGSGPLNIGLGSVSDPAALLSVSDGAGYNSSDGQITIAPNGTLRIDAGGQFWANGDVLVNGGRIERLTSSGFNLGINKNLTAQNNAQVDLASTHSISSGSTYTIESGSDMTVGSFLDIGTSGSGTLIVDGAGSSVVTGTDESFWGAGGNTAVVTIRNSAQATFGGLRVGQDGNASSVAVFTVEGGASATVQGVLGVGTGGAQGSVIVGGTSGDASVVTVAGSNEVHVGTALGGNARVFVNNNGVFDSGLGGIFINATGGIQVSGGGTFNASGDVALFSGGFLTVASGGTFNLAAGRSLSVATLSLFETNVPFTAGAANNISVAGSGAILRSLVQPLTITGGSALAVSSGGSADLNVLLLGNAAGAGDATFSGAGTLLDAQSVTLGASSSTASLTIQNAAAADIQLGLSISSGASPATGAATMTVANSSVAVGGNISVGTAPGASVGTLNVTGTGSLTQPSTASVGVTVGAPAGALDVVNVTGGTLQSGTAGLYVDSTGRVNIDAGGDVYVNGDIGVFQGRIESLDPAGGFHWNATGRSMSVANGGDVVAHGTVLTLSDSNVDISNSGSSVQLPGGGLMIEGGSVVNVSAGGSYSGASLDIGLGAAGPTANMLDVNGVAASVTSTGVSTWGGNGDANVSFRNNAAGSFNNLYVAGANNPASRAYLNIQSGADVNVQQSVTLGNGGEGIITVTGVGSTLTIGPGGGPLLAIGGSGDSLGVINVNNGAALTVANSTSLNPTGTININDGVVSLGSIIANGGVIHFNAGILTTTGSIFVAPGGALGPSVNLTSNHILSSGAIFIDAAHTLTLSGGVLTTETITNSGTLAFNSGTINLTGAAGLSIGDGEPFGDTLELGAGQTFNVTESAFINPSGMLVINSGGRFSADAVNNGGEIRLGGGTARLTAVDVVNNAKLLTGDGRIAANLNNIAGGEVRITNNSRLHFTGSTAVNSGKINLIGGTAEFNSTLVNNAGGTISGRGTLIAQGGISSAGTVQFSGGTSDVFGDVTNSSGGKIIVSGNALATFYDDVTNNAGAEFRVSNGATAVFFGNVTNNGTFASTGTKHFEAGSTGVLGVVASGGTTIVSSGADVSATRVREAALTVEGEMVLAVDGGVSRVGALTVGEDGTLDISNNKMIVTAGGVLGASGGDGTYDGLQGDVQRAYNFGAWDGAGITTSAALALQGVTTVAVATGEQIRGLGPTDTDTFAGELITGTSVILMYTYAGDANMDGQIDAGDYGVLDFFVQIAGADGFANGDFNLDGFIDAGDYGVIDNSIQMQGAPFPAGGSSIGSSIGAVVAVPEPGIIGIGSIALAGATLTRRSRRRRRST